MLALVFALALLFIFLVPTMYKLLAHKQAPGPRKDAALVAAVGAGV